MNVHLRGEGQCELCGTLRPLSVALLRVAWEDRTVQVRACSACAYVAWQTVSELHAEQRAFKVAAE
jgi:hypothetical protein